MASLMDEYESIWKSSADAFFSSSAAAAPALLVFVVMYIMSFSRLSSGDKFWAALLTAWLEAKLLLEEQSSEMAE